MKPKLSREVMAMRIAREFKDGDVVNVGLGLGSIVSNFIPPGTAVTFHAENGVIGYGHVLTLGESHLMDYYLTNAGIQFVAPLPGMCFCDIAEAFDAIRTGRVDVTVLGALQVSERGDLANWTTDPQGGWGTIGGAMDMPVGVKRVIVGMEHLDRQGRPKIVKRCSLPLTAPECVDLIVTELAVIEVTPHGLLLKEIAPGWTVPEVQAMTEPALMVAAGLKEIGV